MRSLPSVRDQVDAALAAARKSGFDGLAKEQRAYLDDFWDRADVELDGDLELQQAVRFAIFHTLQAGARAEQRAIPAKGLTGPGYDGHTFWDAEAFVLPLLTYTVPDAAADALRWRWSTLDLAVERAQTLHLRGRRVPVAHDPRAGVLGLLAGRHRGVPHQRGHRGGGDPLRAGDGRRGVRAHGRPRAARADRAAVALARPPRRRGRVPHRRRDRPRRVHGRRRRQRLHEPDGAVEPARGGGVVRPPPRRGRRARRRRARRRRPGATPPAQMAIPYDDALDVHPQNEDFTRNAAWDFKHTQPEQYPLLLNFPYFDLYRRQVVKQPDLVLAMQFRGDAFTPNQKARNFAYYEAITVRDSSLSACTQAVMAAEVGHLELAYDYFGEAALIDIADLNHNTKDGLHIASLAGAWSAVVHGFGGLRDYDGRLSFSPRLPPALTRLSFRLAYRERRLQVEVRDSEATYTLHRGRRARDLPPRRPDHARARRAADAEGPAARRTGPSRRSRPAARRCAAASSRA